MTSTTAAAYRRPLLDPHDALFRRCLAVAGIAGAVFTAALLLAPIRHVQFTRVDEVPERYARLILEPARPQPTSETAEPLVSRNPDERNPHPGGGGGGGQAGPLSSPGPGPEVPGGGLRDQAPGPAGPGIGAAGRARAQAAIAAAFGGSGASGASAAGALDGLSEALGSAGTDAAVASSRGGRVRVIRAARSDEQLGGGGGLGGTAAADLGRSVVVGSLVSVGGGGGGGSAGYGSGPGGGGGSGGGYGNGVGNGNGSGYGPGSGGGTGGGTGGGIGNGEGAGTGAGGRRGGVAGPGVYRSNASLLAVIQKYAAGIQYCYGNQLKHDPTLRGKLVVALTVAASGEVTQVTVVQNTVGSAALTECALSQIREWRFPAIPEGVTAFQAPFVFTPPS